MLQDPRGGRMQRYPTGLAELTLRYVEQFLLGVEVLQHQGKSLSDTDSGGIEKAEKSVVGVWPQRLGRRQLRSRREQRLDLRFTEDVRLASLLRGYLWTLFTGQWRTPRVPRIDLRGVA